MSTQRQPKGIPIGGQFAQSSHDEASQTLGVHDVVASFSLAGRDYEVEKSNKDGEYRLIQITGDTRTGLKLFTTDSDDEDDFVDEARSALREFRGDNLDPAERLELGVGTVTVRLDPGDSDGRVADTLRQISDDIESGNTSGYYPTWSVGAEKDDEVAGSRTITISLDENRAEDTIREVARSVEDGNTSGYYPNFDIDHGDDLAQETADHIAGLLSYSEVIEDPENDDERMVVVRDPDTPETVYVIAVGQEGNTSSATIDRKAFDDDPREAMSEAEWDTGFEA